MTTIMTERERSPHPGPDCFSSQDLVNYLHGFMSEETKSLWLAHVQQCDWCQQSTPGRQLLATVHRATSYTPRVVLWDDLAAWPAPRRREFWSALLDTPARAGSGPHRIRATAPVLEAGTRGPAAQRTTEALLELDEDPAVDADQYLVIRAVVGKQWAGWNAVFSLDLGAEGLLELAPVTVTDDGGISVRVRCDLPPGTVISHQLVRARLEPTIR